MEVPGFEALLASCWWADKIGFPCTGRASPLGMKRHVEIKILGGLREDKDAIGLEKPPPQITGENNTG
jgi:hypothetical protein